MIALLFDVHGNDAALEAVIADARAQGAAGWVLGGDYAIFGGRPVETLARLRELEPAQWIRGNGERWTADPASAPDHVQGAIAYVAGALGEAAVRELAALPFDARIEGARVVHASPPSDVRSFLPEPGEDEAELLDGVTEPRLIFGHTHLPFRRISTTGGIELVNPGSVGLPFDGDRRAKYALIHPDRRVEHRRVEYDVDAAVEAVRGAYEGADVTVERLESASF